MSGGPKRNPDKLNTIGVVVVGVCGAVLVYVTIVALEAFYVNDTSDIQTMRDYGGTDHWQNNLRVDQQKNLQDQGSPNGVAANLPQSYRIPIDKAMKLVVDDANKPNADFARLAGTALPPASVQPKPLAPPAGAGSAATPPPTTPGEGSAAPTGAGSAAPTTPTGAGSAAPPTPPPPTPPPHAAGSAAAPTTPPAATGSAGSATGGHAP
jgi:hypothetical protein